MIARTERQLSLCKSNFKFVTHILLLEIDQFRYDDVIYDVTVTATVYSAVISITKIIKLPLRPAKAQCQKNMFRAVVRAFSTLSKTYFYKEAINRKSDQITCSNLQSRAWLRTKAPLSHSIVHISSSFTANIRVWII